jgi:hypothetical protein
VSTVSTVSVLGLLDPKVLDRCSRMWYNTKVPIDKE